MYTQYKKEFSDAFHILQLDIEYYVRGNFLTCFTRRLWSERATRPVDLLRRRTERNYIASRSTKLWWASAKPTRGSVATAFKLDDGGYLLDEHCSLLASVNFDARVGDHGNEYFNKNICVFAKKNV